MWASKEKFKKLEDRITTLEARKIYSGCNNTTDYMTIFNNSGEYVDIAVRDVVKKIIEYLKINIIREQAKLTIIKEK